MFNLKKKKYVYEFRIAGRRIPLTEEEYKELEWILSESIAKKETVNILDLVEEVKNNK